MGHPVFSSGLSVIPIEELFSTSSTTVFKKRQKNPEISIMRRKYTDSVIAKLMKIFAGLLIALGFKNNIRKKINKDPGHSLDTLKIILQ